MLMLMGPYARLELVGRCRKGGFRLCPDAISGISGSVRVALRYINASVCLDVPTWVLRPEAEKTKRRPWAALCRSRGSLRAATCRQILRGDGRSGARPRDGRGRIGRRSHKDKVGTASKLRQMTRCGVCGDCDGG